MGARTQRGSWCAASASPRTTGMNLLNFRKVSQPWAFSKSLAREGLAQEPGHPTGHLRRLFTDATGGPRVGAQLREERAHGTPRPGGCNPACSAPGELRHPPGPVRSRAGSSPAWRRDGQRYLPGRTLPLVQVGARSPAGMLHRVGRGHRASAGTGLLTRKPPRSGSQAPAPMG